RRPPGPRRWRHALPGPGGGDGPPPPALAAGEGGAGPGGGAERGGRHRQVPPGPQPERADRRRAAHGVRVPLLALPREQRPPPADRPGPAHLRAGARRHAGRTPGPAAGPAGLVRAPAAGHGGAAGLAAVAPAPRGRAAPARPHPRAAEAEDAGSAPDAPPRAGRPAAGGLRGGRPPLGGSLDERVPDAAGGPGGHGAAPAPLHLPPGVPPALDRPRSPDAGHAEPPVARAR